MVGVAKGSRPGLDSLATEALAYVDALHNLARYLTGNEADAEDLVQETYARALRAAASVHAGHEPQGVAVSDPEEHVPELGAAAAPRPDGGRARHRSTVGRARRRPRRGCSATSSSIDCARWWRDEIEAALMTLSEDARTVILLDLEGLTEVEVADVVGCAVGTVKSRLARARAALRD